MLNEIKLQLTALHPAQLQVTEWAKRFNVVCCGRRWGKTVLGMDRLIHPALQGKPVAWLRRITACCEMVYRPTDSCDPVALVVRLRPAAGRAWRWRRGGDSGDLC